MAGSRGISSVVDRHLALIATASLFVVVGMKLLGVSRGSVTTATAILREAGSNDIVLGVVLVSVLPFGGAMAIGLCAREAYDSAWTGVLRPWLIVTMALLTLVGAFVLDPWLTVGSGVVNAGTAALAVVRRRRPTPSSAHPASTLPATLSVFGLAGALLMVFVVSDVMWLPRSEISENEKTHVGYVLKHDERTVVVLHERDRRVQRLAASGVSSIRYCRREGDRVPLVYQLVDRRPARYPPCPDD